MILQIVRHHAAVNFLKLLPSSNRSLLSSWTNQNSHIKVHPKIRQAIDRKEPVVALESTIITHGMPYPENYETAREVENIVKEKSVLPATIAVLNGVVHVGLEDDELSNLAKSKSSIKISRRGLPASIALGKTGGTTVSATMLISHWCGIPIFVTGGIGGVHRGAENSLDISSDLTELGKTPIAVISAGVKSILDIPKTLEYLETQGVAVATFGETNDFPAFFTPKSGCKSQICVRTPAEAANLIKASQSLKIDSGTLIAVPIPEEHAASGQKIESAIQKSLKEAESLSISGAEVTPYILKRVNEITAGESLKANVALIKHNASVGADIALELAGGCAEHKKQSQRERVGPVVIGATNIDIISKCSSDILYDGPSNPADVSYTLGGVGRNVAESLSRYGNNPVFITAVGDDNHGTLAESEMSQYLDTSFIERIPSKSSGLYVAVMDRNGSLKVGLENLSICDQFSVEVVKKHEDLISQSPLVCIDANLPERTIHYICDLCKSSGTDLLFEPTGTLKAHRPFTAESWKSITYVTPNLQEFKVIVSTINGRKEKINLDENVDVGDGVLDTIFEASLPLMEHINCLIVTLAKSGVATFTQDKSHPSGVCAKHYPLSAMPHFEFMNKPIMNVSGSGDSFAAAFVHGILKKKSVDTCTRMGLVAAQYSLRSNKAVPATLSCDIFDGIENFEWESYPIQSVPLRINAV